MHDKCTHVPAHFILAVIELLSESIASSLGKLKVEWWSTSPRKIARSIAFNLALRDCCSVDLAGTRVVLVSRILKTLACFECRALRSSKNSGRAKDP